MTNQETQQEIQKRINEEVARALGLAQIEAIAANIRLQAEAQRAAFAEAKLAEIQKAELGEAQKDAP